MITKLPESQGAVLGVRITGKVSLEMEKQWIGEVEKVIEEHGKLKILVFLDEHATWGLKAGIEDLKWVLTHMKDMEKVAIVADSLFWKWYVALDRPFGKMVGIDEKYFEPTEITAAWEWLKA
ncbi:MAG: STAS/SEC14 domain-containing protein [Phycisphaerae bacterium]|nr:STAS/SEC14 domain-containing protein [Phycisphaerae bacterium]